MVAVPDFDDTAATIAQSSANVLLAAQEHLGSLLAQVHTAIPSSSTCRLIQGRGDRVLQVTSLARYKANADKQVGKKAGVDAVTSTIGDIESSLGINNEYLAELVDEARRQLSNVK